MTKYWFFDPALARATENVRVLPGQVRKDRRNPLFGEGVFAQPALPWEPRFDNGYPNVFYDPLCGKYRCYYTSFIRDDSSAHTPLSARPGQTFRSSGERVVGLLYAESTDGISWQKPPLGVTEWMGSRDNNILMTYTHGASVLLDQAETDPERRYKLIARDDHQPRRLCVAFSGDGIHFSALTPIPELAEKVPGDTHNFVVRDAATGRYVLYTRLFTRELRTVGRMESEDFIHWTPPLEVLAGQGRDDQVYAMPAFWQDGLCFGLAAIFHAGDRDAPRHDHVEVELTFSGDGVRWQRVAPGLPFIGNGAGAYPDGAYDAGCCFASAPVRVGDAYRFYYMGGNGTHYAFRETGLCLAEISPDKLAGITAARAEKPLIFQTNRIQWQGGACAVCADVALDGCVRYELLDAAGNTLAGFGAEDCLPITEGGGRLAWQGNPTPPEQVMLRFVCRGATLYSLSGDYALLPIHPL